MKAPNYRRWQRSTVKRKSLIGMTWNLAQ